MIDNVNGPGMGNISFLWEDQEPSEVQIERINSQNLKRHANFKIAAEYVSSAFSEITTVRKIVLFGSVGTPPRTETLPTERLTGKGVEVYRACADIDIAVWIDSGKAIGELRTARVRALSLLLHEKGIGVAHHQVDVFLLYGFSGSYMGRLCIFGRCPARKYVCRVAGCGRTPFLRIHEGFVFKQDVFSGSEGICLFERR